MANVIYNSFKEDLMEGTLDLLNDTIKVALVTSSYSPDIDSHDRFDDVTNEVSGTNYTAGGDTLASVTVTKDTTDDEGVFDADDLVFSNVTIAATRGAVIYKDTGTDSTSPLIAYIDFVSDKSATTEDLTIQWAAEGIINIG